MWIRIAIDVTFWLFYSIIGLKVVTALVLDGFTSQKVTLQWSLDLDFYLIFQPNCPQNSYKIFSI